MTFVACVKYIVKLFLPYGMILLYHKLKQTYENKYYSTKGYNQISNSTKDNRYPEIFNHCVNLVENKTEDLMILSFGCSVGKECFSLRSYFHKDNIIGYDISTDNINKANSINNDNKIKFYSDWDEVYNKKFYDIVFVMSVLCRWPQTKDKKNCKEIYSFEQFESQLDKIDSIIRGGGGGGMLII
jgi:hypothetical protein